MEPPKETDRAAQLAKPKRVGSEPLDREGFAALFEPCFGQLWMLASGILGDRSQAEDVVQEAAAIALSRLDQFEPGTNFRAWMSKIVRLESYNWGRKRQRRKTFTEAQETLDQQPDSDSDPSRASEAFDPLAPLPADQTLFDDALTQALNTLGEVPRACLLLRTVSGLSYSEIAQMLDLAEGTAMSHVHRSKTLLRERLKQQDQPAQDTADRE